MITNNTLHTSTSTADSIAWASALLQDNTPEVAPIRAAVIEASRIIANEIRDAAIFKAIARRLRSCGVEGPTADEVTDELHSHVAMGDAVARAAEALREASDGLDSISGLINYESGPGDKAGRKQSLQNILALVQNIWVCEEAYLVEDQSGEVWSAYERLQALIDTAEFFDSSDVEITFETQDETSVTSQEVNPNNVHPVDADALLVHLEA